MIEHVLQFKDSQFVPHRNPGSNMCVGMHMYTIILVIGKLRINCQGRHRLLNPELIVIVNTISANPGGNAYPTE